MLAASIALLAALYLLRYGQKTALRFAKLYGRIHKPSLERPVVRRAPRETFYSTMYTGMSMCCSTVAWVGHATIAGYDSRV